MQNAEISCIRPATQLRAIRENLTPPIRWTVSQTDQPDALVGKPTRPGKASDKWALHDTIGNKKPTAL